MKNLLFTIAFLFTATLSFAQSTVYVSGHTKSNGTYVQPHYRTTPNKTVRDNYSTKGNINPYTGNLGAKSNYSTPSYATPNYSTPTYKAPTYTAPNYSYPTSSYNFKPVYAGTRGGNYYINSNGNKTYIKNK